MKLKTRKAVLKRFKITGKKKLLRKLARQNHFNAKEAGRKTMKKHRLKLASPADEKKLRKQIPYHA
jgi:ribosomal protein L35